MYLKMRFDLVYFYSYCGALPPARTAHEPQVTGAVPLAKYALQFPFVPCEYLTYVNTFFFMEDQEKKVRAEKN